MTASAHFSIKYDGPALDNHQMDVRELAPALIALSNLLEEANKLAFPEAPPVRVNVQGSFKGGSFGVDLIAQQGIADQIFGLLSGREASATANLFGILSGVGLIASVGGGLIGVIKWLAGRKPTTIRFEDDLVVFEIVEDGESDSYRVSLVAGRLYQSRAVRQNLLKVVKPLEREGIEEFLCGHNGEFEAVVDSEELYAFEMAAGDAEVVSDSISEGVLLQIESAVFKEDNKWRFSDGATSFYAVITDEDFLGRVETGAERFGKADVLVVDLRRTQLITDSGLKLEYSIPKVREHRAPLQARLIP